MVAKFYPQNIPLGAVIERKECGSDIEDGPNDSLLPVRWIPDWRALDLTSVLHNFDKMVIALGEETLSGKVAHVADKDKNNVADIGREHGKVAWFFFDRTGKRISTTML